jgi:hypothetical protein
VSALTEHATPAEAVLDLARFAPSGDNSQPWRFVLRSTNAFDVYAYDTRAHCVYDLDGWASDVAHGMLLETIAIAATQYGYRAHIDLAREARPTRWRITLERDAAIAPDALAATIVERSVQRFPLSTRPLDDDARAALEAAAAPFRIRWFDTWPARLRIARLAMHNARIRLTIPEAYDVHRAVIEWRATTSEDRMPDASLGANRMLLALMRNAMTSWTKVSRMNAVTGTLAPRIALDFLPGVRCSASLALVAHAPPTATADRVAAGRAAQRVWLTATRLELQMQPQYTPLVFARYAREGRAFTSSSHATRMARAIALELDDVMESAAERTVWLARIGHARPIRGRSLRLPLSRLVVAEPPEALTPP